MIPSTRRQLTIIYSVMVGFILFIMAVSFYCVLSNVMYRDEFHSLETTGQKAVEEWLNESPLDEEEVREGLQPAYHRMEWEYLRKDQFALITNPIWMIAAQSPGAHNPLLDPAFRQQLNAQASKSYVHLSDHSGKNEAIYAVLRVLTHDEENHVLLIGEDITKLVNLLREMKLLLILITVLLLAVVTVTGYVFAGKAMVPINQAFTRQQKFTAYASHELRTPLSVLQLSVEILEEERDKLQPVHQTVLQDMKEEIQRMTRLTEQLLTLARNDSSVPQRRQDTFDLRHSLSFAAARMQLMADEKKINLELYTGDPEEDFTFIGDREQIDQVLYILLDNAIKYSWEGGVISMGIAPNDNHSVKLSIEDRGCGIPEEDIPHLFERFYRVDQARTREHGGTGLGLAIAYEIVNRHGGQILVNSRVELGSTFSVILPQPKVQIKK